ncbi:MAG: nitrous oxide-stimulated promoter family protein [Sedimentibacter sp.]
MKEDRLSEDVNTVTAMIKIYCNGNHGRKELCDDCLELAQYAKNRVENCIFDDKKPVCGKCTVHCYKPEMREKIRTVMRYSGPKMLYKHPVMLVKYVKDKFL